MDINVKLNEEMVSAAKAKDKIRLSAIRMLKTALHNKEIDLMRPLNESEILQILSAVVKQLNYCCSVTTCGNIGGAELHLNVFPFILRGVVLIGVDSVECPMEDTRLYVWKKLASDWKLDNLEDMVIEVPLEKVEDRIEKLLNKESKGRTLVKVSEK